MVAAFGLIYAFTERIAQLAGYPNGLKITLLVLMLEFDAAFFLLRAFLFLWLFAVGKTQEIRLVPDLESRKQVVVIWAIHSLLILIISIHLYLLSDPAALRSVRWYLLVSCVFYVLDTAPGIVKQVQRAIHGKRFQKPLPVFRGVSIPLEHMPVMMGILLLIGSYAAVTLLILLRALNQSSAGWLLPFQAASQLTLLFATLCLFVQRVLESSSRQLYRELERDILIENLSVDEIRRRFIRESLGLSLSEWLNSLSQEVKEANETVHRMRESVLSEIKGIEAIDQEYQLERLGRVRGVCQKIRAMSRDLRPSVESVYQRVSDVSLIS